MNQELTSQEIILKNRSDLQITGVKKIESLNSNEFYLDTVLGKMVVRGTDLEMKHLDIEKEILIIIGKIYLMEYLNKDRSTKSKGFLAKLFK
ncbi:MAG: sporulation protein YabP [Bacilli bacterium]|nr:sporulation protein YabP [Bacilli bacterium]MDD4076376.1 sporulation protein YabP [Bacilli bacterium]MDD4388652.1 sporulation protein YabP [Bacilli bacterium]